MTEKTAWWRRRLVEEDAQENQLIWDDVINRRWTNGKYSKLYIKHQRLSVPGSAAFPLSTSTLLLLWARDEQAGWVSEVGHQLFYDFSGRQHGHPGFQHLLEKTVRIKCVPPTRVILLAAAAWDLEVEPTTCDLHDWPFASVITLVRNCYQARWQQQKISQNKEVSFYGLQWSSITGCDNRNIW